MIWKVHITTLLNMSTFALGPSSTVSQFVWYYLKKQKLNFFVQFLLCLVWSAKESLFPYFIKNLLNIAHSSQSTNLQLTPLLYQATALLMLWMFMEIAMRIQGWLALRSFPLLKAQIHNDLFKHISQKSYEYFNSAHVGNVANKISELARSCENLLEILILHLTSVSGAVIIGTVLLWQANSNFTYLFLAWLTLHTGLSIFFTKRCHLAAYRHANSVSLLNGKLVDTINNILSVILFDRSKAEGNYLKKYLRKEVNRSRNARWEVEKLKIFQSILAVIYMASMLYCLITGWVAGAITVGDFALVPLLSFSLLGIVWWFSSQFQIIYRDIGTIKSGLTLLKTYHQVKEDANLKPLIVQHGEIILDEITFGYQLKKPLFNKLTLHIPAKQKLGIVGLSGAGKSSFIRLLLRLYEINNGQILIDGQNISNVSLASLRQQIGVIPQDAKLFHRTIEENIKYGVDEVAFSDILNAAQISGCHDFIEQLPEGYKTVVGENGIKLSGGQRQRIAIARAILNNSPILILDEATSALDPITESDIKKNLRNIMQNKTAIIIAHKISTLDDVDRILVFEQGQIVGDGDKNSLLNSNAHFNKLYSFHENKYSHVAI